MMVGALLALSALLFGACGSDDGEATSTESSTTSTSTAETTDSTTTIGGDPQEETRDAAPKLPKGWKQIKNGSAGFVVGAPPGWKSERTVSAQGSILSSPDGRITATVTADRSPGALESELDEFAIAVAETLGSKVAEDARFKDLVVGRAVEFDHKYDAIGVRAVGTPIQTGQAERVLVVAVRREPFASYVFVVREVADRKQSDDDKAEIKRIIRSLRGAPPKG